MKKLSLFILFFVTTFVYAGTCPLPPKGYDFRVAAWGNHASPTDAIRCHYYSYDGTDQIEITMDEIKTKSAFKNHPKWHGSDDFYFLCTSFNKDINDCAFD